MSAVPTYLLPRGSRVGLSREFCTADEGGKVDERPITTAIRPAAVVRNSEMGLGGWSALVECQDMKTQVQRPTPAFIGASWVALVVGVGANIVGLWNADMALNEKGYYFAILMYGLFAAVSLQKSVRDRLEGIPVTGLYFGLCWLSLGLVATLLVVGLWNATILPSEKGFYAMSFLLGLFAAVAVQKNVRDLTVLRDEPTATPPSDP
jgi:uncharacterized membrane protein YiaA